MLSQIIPSKPAGSRQIRVRVPRGNWSKVAPCLLRRGATAPPSAWVGARVKSRPGGGVDGPLRLEFHQSARCEGPRLDSLQLPGEGLYVHPALDLAAFDAGGHALRRTIDDILARFSPFSEEWESLSTALNGTSEVLKVDPEGRIMLSEALRAHTGISETVTFVGHGHKFQIWEPERFRAHLDAARAKLRDVKRALSASPPSPGGAG